MPTSMATAVANDAGSNHQLLVRVGAGSGAVKYRLIGIDETVDFAQITEGAFYVPRGCIGVVLSIVPPPSYRGPIWISIAVGSTTRVRLTCRARSSGGLTHDQVSSR